VIESPGGRRRAVFTGSGISAGPPAELPLGPAFEAHLLRECHLAARRIAADLVGDDALDALRVRRWDIMRRLEGSRPGAAAEILLCLSVTVPNEAHILAAFHVAQGAYHVTLNYDDGIERAYALLAGTADLPPSAPDDYYDALTAWRAWFPLPGSRLRVVCTPADFARPVGGGPILVKLRGSVGSGVDGVLLHPITDEVEVTALGAARSGVIDILAAADFLLIAGYGGDDHDCRPALLARLRPGRFSWVAADVHPSVAAALRAIDPRQPVQAPSAVGLRAHLPASLPAWPHARFEAAAFVERFHAWCVRAVPQTAEAFAWMLADVGRLDQAIALLDRIYATSGRPLTRVRLADALHRRDGSGDRWAARRHLLAAARARSAPAGLRTYVLTLWGECNWHSTEDPAAARPNVAKAIVGLTAAVAIASLDRAGPAGRARALDALVRVLLSCIESRLPAAKASLLSRARAVLMAVGAMVLLRWALRLAGRLAATGRRQASRRLQMVEVEAVIALLRGRHPPPDALSRIDDVQRVHDHVLKSSTGWDTMPVRALVNVLTGDVEEAERLLQRLESGGAVRASSAALGSRLLSADRRGDEVPPAECRTAPAWRFRRLSQARSAGSGSGAGSASRVRCNRQG
jgi:hypothetical protein